MMRHKVVQAALACLYNALDKVMSSKCLDNRDDSRVLADMELLQEKAVNVPHSVILIRTWEE
jgi:hypothetical protein